MTIKPLVWVKREWIDSYTNLVQETTWHSSLLSNNLYVINQYKGHSTYYLMWEATQYAKSLGMYSTLEAAQAAAFTHWATFVSSAVQE